jgi:integrase
VKVALLSREELARLKWEARKDPEVRRGVGLLLFAGVRPAVEDGEITRLEWEAVGEREIYVAHEVSKTGSDRHIPLGRRLRWWLRGHPAEGPVTPPNWKRKYDKLRRAAGIGAGQDLTRHTFASHYLAVHGEQETKQAMGHTAGSDTLLRHYRRAVTKAQGLRYFGVVGRAVDMIGGR